MTDNKKKKPSRFDPKSRWVKYDKESQLWIPSRKRIFLYWFKFLQHAERDSSRKVDWKKYEGWGGANYILGTKFDDFWEQNWKELFGVKNEGGVITKLIRELEVSCLASNIPEVIELDLLEVSLNESLRLSDIKLEEGVEIPNLDDNSDQMVVNVAPPKAIVEDEPEVLDDESMEADSDEGEVKADTGSAEEAQDNDDSGEETKSDN